MTGDSADFVYRLRAALPKQWFASEAPNLTAVLGCLSTPWVWFYGLLGYVKAQTRIASATDSWLDLIAHDFLGCLYRRKPSEGDPAYRARIQNAILSEAATRSALAAGIEGLTGIAPAIFEPARCADTGSYGLGQPGSGTVPLGLAYGTAGGWGSLALPYQVFLTVKLPSPGNQAGLAGYGSGTGGYGAGSISYIDLAQIPGQVTDQDIQSAVCRLLPVNTVAWLRIT
jgi:hypothetical protein